jgi:hypothetical protein
MNLSERYSFCAVPSIIFQLIWTLEVPEQKTAIGLDCSEWFRGTKWTWPMRYYPWSLIEWKFWTFRFQHWKLGNCVSSTVVIFRTLLSPRGLMAGALISSVAGKMAAPSRSYARFSFAPRRKESRRLLKPRLHAAIWLTGIKCHGRARRHMQVEW